MIADPMEAFFAAARASGWPEEKIVELASKLSPVAPAEPVVIAPTRKRGSFYAGQREWEGDGPMHITGHERASVDAAKNGSDNLLRALVCWAREHKPDSDLARVEIQVVTTGATA